MVAHVEMRVRHDHATEQRRDGRFAIQRMRTMDHEAGFDRLLAGIFRVYRREIAHRKHRSASTARDCARASRRWEEIQAACHLKRLQKNAQVLLVFGFHDEVQGVLSLHDRLTVDLHTVLPGAWPAQVIEQHGAHAEILGGTMLGPVLVSRDEECHCRSGFWLRNDTQALRAEVGCFAANT